jgi:hypothetical protein
MGLPKGRNYWQNMQFVSSFSPFGGKMETVRLPTPLWLQARAKE